MTWNVIIFGFETEKEAERCRKEVQIMYAKRAGKEEKEAVA